MADPGIAELAQQTLDLVKPYLLVLASKVPEGTAIGNEIHTTIG